MYVSRVRKWCENYLVAYPQVAFTFILDNVVNNKLKAMSESWPFQKPVNKKLVKDYYEIVKRPMDIETVAKKVKGESAAI